MNYSHFSKLHDFLTLGQTKKYVWFQSHTLKKLGSVGRI